MSAPHAHRARPGKRRRLVGLYANGELWPVSSGIDAGRSELRDEKLYEQGGDAVGAAASVNLAKRRRVVAVRGLDGALGWPGLGLDRLAREQGTERNLVMDRRRVAALASFGGRDAARDREETRRSPAQAHQYPVYRAEMGEIAPSENLSLSDEFRKEIDSRNVLPKLA